MSHLSLGSCKHFLLLFRAIKIAGLDDLNLLNLLEPIAPQTLSWSTQYESLPIEFEAVADSTNAL
jgi:hypothetical protein